ncbi:MAG: hypothetical protein OEZ65_15830 [Gemmatimonadota bacterium]|nr:hypothetical protein [Gemmatimonadota bacterium]MDH5761033.1 hypothetical protein [Gemmatimonadota bacterium]
MDWTLVGALSELLGAMAVVVSLVYLSRQVHQNTTAVRTANAVTVQGNFQQLARMFYTDRDIGDIVLRAMRGEGDLSPADRMAAYAYFFDFLKTAELAYYQFRNGDLDPPLWEASFEFYHAYFTTPGFKAYWAERRSAFVPLFQEAMDEWVGTQSTIKRPDLLVQTPLATDGAG